MALREWFVLNPEIPADLHSLAIVPESVQCPIGLDEYQQSAVGFVSGWR